jgi:hypothetical protein
MYKVANMAYHNNVFADFPAGGTKMDVVAEARDTVITIPKTSLYNKIYEIILAIDNELGINEDVQYREMLVKAAYSLRNLQTHLLIQKQ